MAVSKRGLFIRAGAVTAAAFMATCASGGADAPAEKTEQAGAGLGSTNGTRLHLTQETRACSATSVQNVLKIANESTSPVPLSSVSIKMWVDETTAASIVSSVSDAGCISAHGTESNDCAYQGKVRGVTATAVHMASPCGAGANGQANWEVTITNTDTGVIPAGQSWHKINTKIALPNNAAFTPGASSWYSSCQPIDNDDHETARMAVYINGDLVTASPGVPPSCVAPHGTQPVPGTAAPAIVEGEYPLVGPLPADVRVDLAISLPLQHTADLDDFIRRTQDPTDPLFHQYLDPAGFGAAYGPSQADHDAVIAWAAANNLTVTAQYPSRALLNIRGTVADVEKALYVTLNQYKRADGSIFYAPANDPSTNLSVPIIAIAGLDNIAIPQPQGGTGGDFLDCPAGSGSGGKAYARTDFRKAYFPGIANNNDGTDQTIALIEFDGFYGCAVSDCSSGFVSDPATYAAPMGITLNPPQIVVNKPPQTTVSTSFTPTSACSTTPCPLFVSGTIDPNYPSSGVLTVTTGGGSGGTTRLSYSSYSGNQFNITGGNTAVTLQPGDLVNSPLIPGSGALEAAMDVELVAAMAPHANIKLYEWEHNGGVSVSSAAFPTVLSAVANDHTVTIVNNSWVWQSTGAAQALALKDTFRQMAAQGVTFIQAAGDTGAYVEAASCTDKAGHCKLSLAGCLSNTDCPASGDQCLSGVPSPIIDSPYMLVVGGTQLTTDDTTQAYTSETVWNNSTHAGTPPVTIPLFGASSGGKALCYRNGLGIDVPTLDRPLWQQTLVSGIARGIPDVTMVATQIAAQSGSRPATLDFGALTGSESACNSGTSASSALWAGVAALINQQAPKTYGALGFANPRLYNIAQSAGNFRDVTTGGTTFNNSGLTGVNAGVGYDLASGLGSPTTQLIGSSLPTQSCQSGSNLTVVVNPSNNQVVAYVPNGSWSETATGIMAIELEGPFGGAPTARTLIPTTDAVNTCAGDSATGRVVCTGNNNHIYLIEGTIKKGELQSNAASGIVGFSGGYCTTCNVAVDTIHHDAWISMALPGNTVGVQRLDVAAAWSNLPNPDPNVVLDAAITTETSNSETLSEAISVDPGVVGGRRLVLAPNEENNYQLVSSDPDPMLVGTVYNNSSLGTLHGLLDHAAEDCSTGLILASVEFSQEIYIADLKQATFTGTGMGATWSTPGQSVTAIPELNDPIFGGGVAGGIAVSSNNALHLGIMSNEFGGNGFVVFQLPSTSGSGTPQLVDWVAVGLPNTPPPQNAPWQMGWDPHTIGVYTSPNTGRQYAIFQNDPNQDGSGARDWIALVDMEKALTVAPRTGTHMIDPSYNLVTNGIVRFIQNTP